MTQKSPSWAGGLLIALAFSLNSGCGSVSTSPETLVSGYVSESEVPCPDYTADISGLSLLVDASGTVVRTSNGQILMVPQSVPGFEIAIVDTDPGPLYDDVQAAFAAAQPNLIIFNPLVLSGPSLRITAGTQLPTSRYAIISSYPKVGTNLRSFQILSLHVNPPG